MRQVVLSFALALLVSTSAAVWAQEEQEFTFQTVVYPGDTFTQLLGINLSSTIAGYHGATINKGFVLTLPSTFMSQNFPGSAQTQVTGINNVNNTSGFYIDTKGVTHGYLKQGSVFRTVDFPGTT